MGIRPDHIQIANDGISANVEVSELMGSSYHLHTIVKGKDVVIIVPTHGKQSDYIGKEVKLSFTGSVCHVFSKDNQSNLEY